MLHIPILRHGQPYESVDHVTLVHHATGEPIARVSQANSGMLSRDIGRMDDRALEGLSMHELIAIARRAASLFMEAELPVGDQPQSFDDYVRQLSATTGMPVSYCRGNAQKIRRVLDEIELVLAGLTRGLDLDVLDRGYGLRDGHMLSFYRGGRVFGAVLPRDRKSVG